MADKKIVTINSPDHAVRLGASWVLRFFSRNIFGTEDEFQTTIEFCGKAAFFETGGVGANTRDCLNAFRRNWHKEMKAHGFHYHSQWIREPGSKIRKLQHYGWRKFTTVSFSDWETLAINS